MNIENQVCSLELAKQLCDAGIKQKSIFLWEYFDEKCHAVKFIQYAIVPDKMNGCELYPAFTAGELGEMLPRYIDTRENAPFNCFRISMTKSVIVENFVSAQNIESHVHTPIYLINYDCDTSEFTPIMLRQLFEHNIWDKNEANARAKVLIELVERGYIKTKTGSHDVQI